MKNEIGESETSSSSPAKSNGHWQSPAARPAQIQEQVIKTAKRAYSDFMEMAGDSMSSANRQAAKYIRQYPVQIAAGAMTVGFLLGAALFRRKA